MSSDFQLAEVGNLTIYDHLAILRHFWREKALVEKLTQCKSFGRNIKIKKFVPHLRTTQLYDRPKGP